LPIDPKTVFWDDWLLLVVQIASLVALVIYVIKTWQMASATRIAAEATRDMAQEARDARMGSLAPRIVVYFDSSRNLEAHVVIRNAGVGTAANVRVSFDPPLQSTDAKDPFKAFFDLPQSVMPPGYTITHPFDTWPTYLSSSLPRKYIVTVEYSGLENDRQYKTQHEINVESLRWRVVHGDPLHIEEFFGLAKKAAHQLENIARTFSDHSAAQLYFHGLGIEGKEAAKVLASLWVAAQQAQSSESFIVHWNAMLGVYRALALAAVARDARFPLSSAQTKALQEVLVTLHRFDANAIGNDEWQERAKTAFTELTKELADTTTEEAH
jgi:hypothetical protein